MFRYFLSVSPHNDLFLPPQKYKQDRDIPYAPKDSIFGRELTQDQRVPGFLKCSRLKPNVQGDITTRWKPFAFCLELVPL